MSLITNFIKLNNNLPFKTLNYLLSYVERFPGKGETLMGIKFQSGI